MTDPHTTEPPDEELIGHVTVNDHGDYFTACLDCSSETDHDVDAQIYDREPYGDDMPYPECFYCQEVIRPLP